MRVAILSMSLCCFSFSLARIAATSASDLGGVSASVDTSGRVSEAPRRPGAIGRTHLLDPLFRRCIERSVARFVAPTPRAPPMAACGHSAAHIADDMAIIVETCVDGPIGGGRAAKSARRERVATTTRNRKQSFYPLAGICEIFGRQPVAVTRDRGGAGRRGTDAARADAIETTTTTRSRMSQFTYATPARGRRLTSQPQS